MGNDKYRQIFEDRLRHFVNEWSPANDRDRYEMQRQLSMLFVDAMKSQHEVFAAGVNNYASQILEQASLRPLNVIFEKE